MYISVNLVSATLMQFDKACDIHWLRKSHQVHTKPRRQNCGQVRRTKPFSRLYQVRI